MTIIPVSKRAMMEIVKMTMDSLLNHLIKVNRLSNYFTFHQLALVVII
jgi:hypothetical protein